jgi:hypothetical protein
MQGCAWPPDEAPLFVAPMPATKLYALVQKTARDLDDLLRR